MIRSVQLPLALFGVLCLLTFVGCPAGSSGPATVPAKGTLTIDGQPAKDVMITLSSVDPALPVASGHVVNGAFELRSGKEGKPGAVPGKYKITLAAMPSAAASADAYKPGMTGPPKIEASFPVKYNSPTTSDKEVEIKSGPNDLKIEITK